MDEGGSALTYTLAVGNETMIRCGLGDYDDALRLGHEYVARCERIGDAQMLPRALNTLGWIYGQIEDHDEAMGWNRRSVELARAAGFPDFEVEANGILNLGDNLFALGRLDEAEECFQQVEAVVRNPSTAELWALWLYSQHHFASYGELRLARGDARAALSYADECIALAESTERQKNVVKGRRLRGLALIALGDLEAAEGELTTALAVATRVGNPPQLWRSHAAIGDLRRAQARPSEARQHYSDAVDVIEHVAGRLEDEIRRATFLESQHVRGIQAARG